MHDMTTKAIKNERNNSYNACQILKKTFWRRHIYLDSVHE